MSVKFQTLNPNAPIFRELEKGPSWWKRFKNDSSLYIEVRKDNQVNVYFEGGSIARIHYCSKHKQLQIFTHHKYLDKPAPSKNNPYIECSSFIEDVVDKNYPDYHVYDKIIERVKSCYSRKKAHNEEFPKEEWSEKYIQGTLIVKSREFHLDSEFAYKDGESDNRIDFIRCDNGKITFVELKRIGDSRMLHQTDETPEVVFQMQRYEKFIEKHSDELLAYYQKVYDIKQRLGLPVPHSKPMSINKEAELLIFDGWVKNTKRRTEHRSRLYQILKNKSVKYYVKTDF